MRKLWLVIAVVVLTTAGLVGWLMADPEATSPRPVDSSTQLDQPFVRAASGDELLDAGVGRVSGRVVDQNLTPVAGARVRLFASGPELEDLECSLCHLAVLSGLPSKSVT